MKPEFFFDGQVGLYCGDCIEVMHKLPSNSVDSIVTDPPYHLTTADRFSKTSENDDNQTAEAARERSNEFARLSKGFMGKSWDGGDIAYNVDLWKEALRVLKPGGHIVAFGGTRTYHRMACAIEDAGFEIRDSLMWIYGQGFPKSQNVSRDIDDRAGVERDVVGPSPRHGGGANNVYAQDKWTQENINGPTFLTAPITEEAKQWDGWGTALKPAHEPIVFARKPLSEKTVASNVLLWGTGAINVDGCRVESSLDDQEAMKRCNTPGSGRMNTGGGLQGTETFSRSNGSGELDVTQGRWPANVVHDGSDVVVAGFPDTKSPGTYLRAEDSRTRGSESTYGEYRNRDGNVCVNYGDSGSVVRFFYCAKANKLDRCGSKHPTIKPVSLLQWLVRLVTPPGGLVFDPFAGSGTTAHAALLEGCTCVLVEKESEYQTDIRTRMGFLNSEGISSYKPPERPRRSNGKGNGHLTVNQFLQDWDLAQAIGLIKAADLDFDLSLLDDMINSNDAIEEAKLTLAALLATQGLLRMERQKPARRTRRKASIQLTEAPIMIDGMSE